MVIQKDWEEGWEEWDCECDYCHVFQARRHTEMANSR